MNTFDEDARTQHAYAMVGKGNRDGLVGEGGEAGGP